MFVKISYKIFYNRFRVIRVFLSGHFRILGRNVPMRYVKEQLGRKGISFDARRATQPPAVTVEVLADSLFIEVCKLHTDITCFSFKNGCCGGSRGGARGTGAPPLFWAKKEEMTAEGRKAIRASKSKPPPPSPLAQGLDPPLSCLLLFEKIVQIF